DIKGLDESLDCHAYAGVDESGKFILIIVPLDKNGKEKEEKQGYQISALTALDEPITLVERTTTETKTKLDTELNITKHWKEVDLPVYSEPNLAESVSAKDIEKWKDECYDWFEDMIETGKTDKIFRAFKVPVADLEVQEGKEVLGLFGFKNSTLYQMQIPILIFVEETPENDWLLESRVNTRDWSHPNPPYGNKDDFSIFD
ncbi:MAG: hypothetical protein MK076_10945, partial [Flavobacteriales bacterium]|nr:hypothetical protein [Flavobacteriales bacterium]